MMGNIFRQPEAAEYYFREGCFILELLNDPADPSASIARARVPVGGTTRWHALRATTERYVILAGAGEVHVGDAPAASVWPGDVVLVPPSTRQRIRNTGTTDLVFLAVCTPRFHPDAYIEMEEQA